MNYLNMPIRMAFALLIAGVSISCMNPTETKSKEIRYVPLGDSYTIGTGAGDGQSWPEVLTRHLNDSGFNVKLLNNPARNGFTTDDLIRYELPYFLKEQPDFATLCIGTNDWNTGMDSATFRKNLAFILDTVLGTLTHPSNFIVLTVPDFGLTPAARIYAQGRDISAGLRSFNAIILEEAQKRNIRTVDIYTVSLAVTTDPSLISDDELHPSDKGYALWEKSIFPVAAEVLRNDQR
jgi:acyl-CoA thioesterase I